MGDSTFNFCVDELFNPNSDITWSFQYSVSGGTDSSGLDSNVLFSPITVPIVQNFNTQVVSVTTIAGSTVGDVNGDKLTAKFNSPAGIILNSGVLYIADYLNNKIRSITPSPTTGFDDPIIATFAGSVNGWNDAIGTAAQFSQPQGMDVDSSGKIFVCDSMNSTLRMIELNGLVSSIPIGSVSSSMPYDIVINGNIFYITDNLHHCIIKYNITTGAESVFAGVQGSRGTADGIGANARFDSPAGIDIDSLGNLYVADANNHRIRKIEPNGNVSTFAGSTKGFNNATGTAAKFSGPLGLVVANNDDIYVVDDLNQLIRKITSTGIVTTVAGITGVKSNIDGDLTVATFNSPIGLCYDDTNDTLYVTDGGSSRIRKISIPKLITTPIPNVPAPPPPPNIKGSTGGFSTFLFKNTTLTGGGRYSGLGYAPYQADFGVTDAIIGIMFASNNTITIKNQDFETIYTSKIIDSLYPFVKTHDQFNTIRIHFTNSGKNLIIALKDNNDIYNDIINIETDLNLPKITDLYKIGFSYSTPLESDDDKVIIKLKDIHFHGNSKISKTTFVQKPPSNIKSSFILQSPLSGSLIISYNNKSIGSLVC